MLVAAHRANTPRWLRIYLEEGAEAFEVDAYQEPGRIMVSHLEPRRKQRLLRERLASLLAGLHLHPPRRLGEHLQEIPRQAMVMVDLKTRVDPVLLREAVEEAGRRPWEVMVATRWHNQAPGLARQGFRVLLSLDCHPYSVAGLAPRNMFHGVTVNYTYLTTGLVEEAHRHGLLVAVWRVNTASEAAEAVERGADIVITDYPSIVRRVLQGLQADSPAA